LDKSTSISSSDAARRSMRTFGRMNTDTARAYWASMTHGEKLFFVVANGNAASFAYNRLDLHCAAAHRQMARIADAITDSKSSVPEPKAGASQEEMRTHVRDGMRRMQPVLYEVHFYFVAWANCRNMLEILTGQPEFREAKKVFDAYRRHFEHYVAGRNSFEHFHDRLPGQRDAERVREIRDDASAGARRVFAGFAGGKYVHSDLSWDISPKSLELLNQSIAEVLAVVHRTIDEEFRRRF
jgi:hypothetical protein